MKRKLKSENREKKIIIPESTSRVGSIKDSRVLCACRCAPMLRREVGPLGSRAGVTRASIES
jgi:hypothetical protein